MHTQRPTPTPLYNKAIELEHGSSDHLTSQDDDIPCICSRSRQGMMFDVMHTSAGLFPKGIEMDDFGVVLANSSLNLNFHLQF